MNSATTIDLAPDGTPWISDRLEELAWLRARVSNLEFQRSSDVGAKDRFRNRLTWYMTEVESLRQARERLRDLHLRAEEEARGLRVEVAALRDALLARAEVINELKAYGVADLKVRLPEGDA